MKVPNSSVAIVPSTKITEYLLSEKHPDGKHKARYFLAFGFRLDQWQVLEQALRGHIGSHDVAKLERSPFGVRYVVEGIMPAPDGRSPRVRTVWFIESSHQVPKFVTAYPLPRGDND